MKDIRPQFTPEEYARLRRDADRLGVSLKQLVHDRALGTDTSTSPLNSAKILSDEISKTREVMNRIIKREATAEIRLYEDDVIRLEMTMENIEAMVAAYITQVLKAVKSYGDTEI